MTIARGRTIWIIGLAGAGKTTIGRAVATRLRHRDAATVMLDGDELRRLAGDDLGHSLADRERNGWRMARMCAFLNAQGVNVVCGILSLFPAQRAWNRANLPGYLEVLIEVPMAELERRDQKGLYSGARAGTTKDVAGIDLPFARPDAHLVVANAGPVTDCDAIADRIVEAFDRSGAR